MAASRCELWQNSQHKLVAIWGLGCRRKGNGEREREVSKGVSLVMIQPFAWEKKWFCFSCEITKVPLSCDLDCNLDLQCIVGADQPHVQVWWQFSPLPVRTSNFYEITSAHITRPLTSTLTFSTSWVQTNLETILCEFGGDPAICLGEEAICTNIYRWTDRWTDGCCTRPASVA